MKLIWGMFSFLFLVIAVPLLLSRCGGGAEETSSSTSGQYIYITSGNTFAGTGITTSTAANTVAKYSSSGSFIGVIRDYNDAISFTGDTPTGIVAYGNDLLVGVENATTTAFRRIERISADGSSVGTFLMNSTAFNAANRVIKDLFLSSDGGFLVSKGTTSANAVIEKFNSSKARITISGSAYVTAPAGSCATAQTQFSRIVTGPSGTIVAAHAAATTNNKVLLISSTGYSSGADCLSAVTGPTANHIPTSLLYHSSSGKLFVAYGSSTGPVHDIYSYDITATAISNPVLAYSNISILQGISAMAQGPDGSIYIASANTGFNTIEKFTYDSGSGLLVRATSTPLIVSSIYTRSISGIAIP
jgi:hypothetical protein